MGAGMMVWPGAVGAMLEPEASEWEEDGRASAWTATWRYLESTRQRSHAVTLHAEQWYMAPGSQNPSVRTRGGNLDPSTALDSYESIS
eukprot:2906825-Rhodomonas_salina.2